MSKTPDDTKISKFFSYVLRHKPDAADLVLDSDGWCATDALINGARQNGLEITRDDLVRVVENNDKRRFALSGDGSAIRAVQGHSNKDIRIAYEAVTPPVLLYHGTATRFLDAILAEGLKPQGRQYVHLSADHDTAVKVGQRHGRPVVLRIAAKRMFDADHVFHRADNGVWLSKVVPVSFLELLL